MFATLHYFEDETFFINCPYIYVYTDGKVLAYEVFAAYTGDNAHILNTNDFTTESGRQQYIDGIRNNGQETANLREETAAEVTTDSRILTLSTCVSGKANNRFLVQAVLVSEAEL
jgi:sortase B